MDKEIKVYFKRGDEIEIDRNLAMRFLRVKSEPDKTFMDVFDECCDELKKEITYKSSYRYFDIKIENNKVFFDDEMVLESSALCKCLDGCVGAFVFVATATLAVDRLIFKYSKLQVAKSCIINALGSSAVECFCDDLCNHFEKDYNLNLRPRYSPGYGDLDLLCQKDVLNVCRATTLSGITLTKSNLMIPRKSVSAIVGVKKK